jgi:nitrate/TMAO reductase-like tetraheme cytochrome c subunit
VSEEELSRRELDRQPKWCRLVSGSPRKAVLVVTAVGLVFGILFWGGLNTVLEYTNRMEFCLSCHEMHIPYEEYKKTAHYANRTGTTVTCSDCHVPSSKTPGDYGRKVWRKIEAARDVWGHLAGTIDTPEKFEAHRLTMAEREWKRMKAADSRECRNCHDFATMQTERQKKRAVRKHEEAVEEKMTCIDCHKGIAHKAVHIARADDQGGADGEGAYPVAQAVTPAVADTAAAPAAVAAPVEVAVAVAAPAVVAAPVAPSAAPAAAPAAGRTIDWTKVQTKTVPLFYPGQAGLEWVLNKADHSSANQLLERGRACTYCHDEDAHEIGQKIAAGRPAGNAKVVLDNAVPAGKRGAVPVTVYAAHDGAKLYLRFEWEASKSEPTEKMDPKNEIKLAVMLDDGHVEGAKSNGCWSTCHMDLRGMPDASDTAREHERAKDYGWQDGATKYLRESRTGIEMANRPRGGWDKLRSDEEIAAALKAGKFMDLMQFRSGRGEKPVDGYVLESRHMDGGKGLVKAEGRKEGNKWVVTFERLLSPGGKGDHKIVKGRKYNIGFAIHEGFTSARFHHVSLGYNLALDDEDAFFNAVKQ